MSTKFNISDKQLKDILNGHLPEPDTSQEGILWEKRPKGRGMQTWWHEDYVQLTSQAAQPEIVISPVVDVIDPSLVEHKQHEPRYNEGISDHKQQERVDKIVKIPSNNRFVIVSSGDRVFVGPQGVMLKTGMAIAYKDGILVRKKVNLSKAW